MRFDGVIISLLTAVLLLWCGLAVIDEQFADDKYNVTIENEVFANITQTGAKIYNESYESKEDYQESEVGGSNAEDNLFVAAWKSVGTIWTYFGYIDDILIQFAKAFGIPPYITNIFMIMLLVSTIFGIAYMIFGYTPR